MEGKYVSIGMVGQPVHSTGITNFQFPISNYGSAVGAIIN